jgi:hypothetical protein
MSSPPYQILRIDIIGSLPRSRKGECYVLNVLEDYYGVTRIFPLIRKSDALLQMQALVKRIMVQHGYQVKIIMAGVCKQGIATLDGKHGHDSTTQ